jgi:hypothetical protein
MRFFGNIKNIKYKIIKAKSGNLKPEILPIK